MTFAAVSADIALFPVKVTGLMGFFTKMATPKNFFTLFSHAITSDSVACIA